MKKKKRYTNKEDMFLKITLIQLTVALILFAVFFGISKINSNLFAEMKRQFADLLEDDFDYNDFVPFGMDEVFLFFGEESSVVQESAVLPEETQAEETEPSTPLM